MTSHKHGVYRYHVWRMANEAPVYVESSMTKRSLPEHLIPLNVAPGAKGWDAIDHHRAHGAGDIQRPLRKIVTNRPRRYRLLY